MPASPAGTRPGAAGLPPLALGGALLLWGWQNELLVFAVPMAVVFELARWVPWRWQLHDTEFHRIADVSGVALLLVVLYQFDQQAMRGIYGVLQWLPFVLGLLTLSQVYSTRDEVKYTALFLSVRRAAARGRITRIGALDLRGPYFVACLVSASAGTVGGHALFPLTAALVALALWPQRSRRFSTAAWALTLAGAVGLGYVAERGVVQLRSVVEPAMMSWFHDLIMSRRDPYRTYTAMGQIGRLKLSDRIVARVRTDGRPGLPPLLRTATFRSFSRNMWTARGGDFEPVRTDIDGLRWYISPGSRGDRHVTVSTYMRRGRGLLAVPLGTYELDDMPVDRVYRNEVGTLKVLRGPGHVEYRARYLPGAAGETPPDDLDLVVPVADEALMTELVDELGLRGLRPGEVLAAVERYFNSGFTYSVTLRRPTRLPAPLHEFLRVTRSGHCEFFASATVLLLRAAGVPARYATGFSVQEWSPIEEAYVVRRRHAHAWAVAWVDGAWRDVDTTPAVWADLEAAEAPWWEELYDVGSWLAYLYSRWRWSPSEEGAIAWILWLLLPLTALLAWRLYRGERVASRRAGASVAAAQARAGADSELYEVERALAARGLGRSAGESLGEWLAKLERTGEVPGAGRLAEDVLPIHYRYRFDPAGLPDAERVLLRDSVRRWRSEHSETD